MIHLSIDWFLAGFCLVQTIMLLRATRKIVNLAQQNRLLEMQLDLAVGALGRSDDGRTNRAKVS